MWTEDLLVVLGAPYAAFELRPDGASHTFPDLASLSTWALARKGARKFSLSDGHLVWGDAEGEQRATVALDLTAAGDAKPAESWRILTAGETAAGVLAAVRAARSAQRMAA